LSGLLGGELNCKQAPADGWRWLVAVPLACYPSPERRSQALIHTPKSRQLAGNRPTPTVELETSVLRQGGLRTSYD